MNKTIAKKWVAALRSGNYKQGKEALRNTNDEYCCLGVLCDIIDDKCWILPAPDLTSWQAVFGTERSTEVLPEALVKITGMIGANSRIPIGSQDSHRDSHLIPLAELNDTGMSFDKIADLIEMHWKSI